MLDITKCEEDVARAKLLAQELGGGALESFETSFGFLERFRKEDPSCRVVLTRDESPHSFNFRIFWGQDQDCAKFNGAMLFYGGAESGSSGPQFSVSLSGRTDARWEIHT